MTHRIPSLDGLRAVSITAVLLGHLTGTRGFPGLLAGLVESRYLDLANLGVRVFFVISGFLITGLLLQEQTTTGRISLPRFYLRRTLRIFPAYFTLLAVLAVLAWGGAIAIPAVDFLHAVTYTANYEPGRVWQVGHLWSLAVEEQFYLLWPAAMLLARTRRGATKIALATVCLVPLIRLVLGSTGHLALIGNSFETTADAIAIGCLLALTRDELFTRSWYQKAVSSRWIAPLILLVGILVSLRFRPSILLGTTLVNLAIVLGVDRCVRYPEDRLGRILNAPILIYVGGLSYSLYLWQQLFLNRHSAAGVNAFPLNLALAVLCALASYYMIERPALRLRPRVERLLHDNRRLEVLDFWLRIGRPRPSR